MDNQVGTLIYPPVKLSQNEGKQQQNPIILSYSLALFSLTFHSFNTKSLLFI